MRFEPRTENQVQEAGLLVKGVYDFVVLTAEDKTSAAGNEMIALKLGVEDGERQKWVNDYLLATEGGAYKLRHFAASVGMLPEYEAGELTAASMRDRAGKCKIGIDPAKDGFAAKNKVTDYVVPAMAKAASGATKADDDMDTEIPF